MFLYLETFLRNLFFTKLNRPTIFCNRNKRNSSLLFITYLAKRIFSRSDQFQNPAGRNQLSANPARKVEIKIHNLKEEDVIIRITTIKTSKKNTYRIGHENSPGWR